MDSGHAANVSGATNICLTDPYLHDQVIGGDFAFYPSCKMALLLMILLIYSNMFWTWSNF